MSQLSPHEMHFQVGVTGHRTERIVDADAWAIFAAASEVLRRVQAAALQEAGTEGCRLRLLSSLAEGSDRMVARAALELGYELEAPLPLPPDDFERDFATQVSRDDFRSLLERAATAFVVERDGSSRAPESDAREAAYERAGRYVNAQSDLLIAIWDGKAARGRGGTGQVVDEATDRGIPVAWIPLSAPNDSHLLDADGATRPLDAIDDVVRDTLMRRRA